MIKVLHVVHTMECGGIETMLMNIYKKIDREEIQFDFLVNGKRENYYTDEIISLGGNVLNVTPKRKNFIKNIIETIDVMKKGNYQVVHIHQDSMISFGVWCAKRAGIKKIFTHAHTTSDSVWYRKTLTKLGRRYIKKNATLKFACSEAAANWIYGKNSDYILFKNAIDASKFRHSKEKYEKIREELSFKKSDIVLGTCGRFSIEKNQKFLIEIFSKIKSKERNCKLVLIGDGSEKESLVELARNLRVEEDTIFTGLVSNVEYYYSALDGFVLPSFYEGLPLVGVEAQAAGIPCFFSTGITSEIKITDNVHFLNLEEGAAVWADYILEHLSDKEDTYEKIKKAGYDIGANVDMLQSKYKEGFKEKESDQ